MEKHPAMCRGGGRAARIGLLEALWDLVRWPFVVFAFLTVYAWLRASQRVEILARRYRAAFANRPRGGT